MEEMNEIKKYRNIFTGERVTCISYGNEQVKYLRDRPISWQHMGQSYMQSLFTKPIYVFVKCYKETK